jgi:hypothetical protein
MPSSTALLPPVRTVESGPVGKAAPSWVTSQSAWSFVCNKGSFLLKSRYMLHITVAVESDVLQHPDTSHTNVSNSVTR